MAEDGIEQFVSVTGASKEDAKFYLDSAGGNVETAIDSFFGTGGGAADVADEGGALMDEGPADAPLASVPSTGVIQQTACMRALLMVLPRVVQRQPRSCHDDRI